MTVSNLPASPGGPIYRKVWNPNAGVFAYRAQPLKLYYRDNTGKIHAHRPGVDAVNDANFLAQARPMGLRLVTRKERRAMWRKDRRR